MKTFGKVLADKMERENDSTAVKRRSTETCSQAVTKNIINQIHKPALWTLRQLWHQIKICHPVSVLLILILREKGLHAVNKHEKVKNQYL